MNWMTIPAMIGPTVGPIVGGFLTTYLSWRAIFYLNLPIGVTGVVLALWLIEDFRAPAPTRFDLRGFFIAGLGLALLEIAIENVGRPMIPGPLGSAFFIAAFGMLLLYGWHVRRCPEPILDLRLLRVRTFRIGTVTGSVCRMGLDAVPFLLPLLFQVGFGLSPLQSGLLSFSSSLGAMLVRTVSGAVLRIFGFRRLLAGNACLAAAVTAGCGLLRPDTPVWVIVFIVLLSGCTRSIQYLGLNTISYADVPGAGVEQEHERRRCRPAIGQGLWDRGRGSAARADRRASDADNRRFPPRLLSDRAAASALRPWIPASFPDRWRRSQPPRIRPTPLGVTEANGSRPPLLYVDEPG